MKTVGGKILFVLALLLCDRIGAQNVVVQWNAIASATIISNAKEGSVASGVWLAYVHLAAFDAVNAIDHRFQPYLFTTRRRALMKMQPPLLPPIGCW